LIPCHGLRPRRARIALPCPIKTIGDECTAFRQKDNVSGTINTSWLNPFTCVAAQYPIPLASPQPVTRLDAGFSSEVAANLSSGWICTNWIL
jgi:hypothetical protein